MCSEIPRSARNESQRIGRLLYFCVLLIEIECSLSWVFIGFHRVPLSATLSTNDPPNLTTHILALNVIERRKVLTKDIMNK